MYIKNDNSSLIENIYMYVHISATFYTNIFICLISAQLPKSKRS